MIKLAQILRLAGLHLILVTLSMNPTTAQDNLSYQSPDPIIQSLVDAPPTPGAYISPNGKWILMAQRPSMPSIEEVAQTELRLAGIRIQPRTNGSSRSSYFNGLILKDISSNVDYPIQGLPENARIENITWASDGNKIAFTQTLNNGIELWIIDTPAKQAKRLTEARINDAMNGIPYRWFQNGKCLIAKVIPENRGSAPEESLRPFGPTIQSNSGESAPVRTYQDLLKNQHDIALFEYYTQSELHKIDPITGKTEVIAPNAIYSGITSSPDGKYSLLTEVVKPYSYIVPFSRFAQKIYVIDEHGKQVKLIAEIPASENIPKGFGATRTGPRSFSWRSDADATLNYVEALDGGDPKKETPFRDQVFLWEAPFDKPAIEGPKTKFRYGGINWCDSEKALIYEWWWTDRREVTQLWNPSNPALEPKVIFDRSWEDTYTDPGGFQTTENENGRRILRTSADGNSFYLVGQGASDEGNRPFIDTYEIASGKTARLWRSEAPFYERPVKLIDIEKGLVLTRRESEENPANFFIRNLKDGSIEAVTKFENPYKALDGVKKELIKYKRKDGVDLTGTLYLPAGYNAEKDGPLPTLMWAYPKEFKSKDAASQVDGSPYEFTRLGWYSPIFWVTQGYAVFDDFGMPIVGEGKEEPNETFVEQLTMDAEAAIDKLAEMGVSDRNRLAVGGHSYGAFMTANLLAHTDLFAAGIARSGAYNRTLTPFGFQSEERTFWETPDTYFKMSPFMHADKIKAPLLMIHGQADNNSGTYPMQSERMYGALKGLGANVRLVMLPHESHGYQAKESIHHMLWEMSEWLDNYVKDKKVLPKP